MEIEGYCSVFSIDEPIKLTGCGIILSFINSDCLISRRLGFALSCSDLELAWIQAVRLALSSISSSCRRCRCIVFVNDDRVIETLNNGDNSKYKKAASDLLRLFRHYPDLKIVYTTDTNSKAIEIAKNAAITQKNYDSGNIDGR